MNAFKQLSNLLCLLLCVVTIGFLSSCEADIPAVDTQPPTVRFTILGNGINEIMENPPQEVYEGPGGIQYLDLSSGVSYDFTVIAADAGGVRKVSLRVPFDAVVEADGAATVSTMGLHQFITIEGDPSDPLTGLAISGSITLPRGLAFDFIPSALDYGGQNGTSNSRLMVVSAFSQ